LTDTQDTALGRTLAGKRTANPGQSGFHLLGNGLDAFVARAVLSQLAERSIDSEYFAADPDLAFADLDVMAIGPAVQEVSAAFDPYWNSELAYEEPILRPRAQSRNLHAPEQKNPRRAARRNWWG
jgi:phosphatidylserine/phosphatidylglycerophosphate/cardiolipin synthase-like enzyme